MAGKINPLLKSLKMVFDLDQTNTGLMLHYLNRLGVSSPNRQSRIKMMTAQTLLDNGLLNALPIEYEQWEKAEKELEEFQAYLQEEALLEARKEALETESFLKGLLSNTHNCDYQY